MSKYKKIESLSEEERQKLSEVNKFYDSIKKIVLFCGNLQEYERWCGHECEIIEPVIKFSNNDQRTIGLYKYSSKDKSVIDVNQLGNLYNGIRDGSDSNIRKLFDKGLEAIVNVQFHAFDRHYGLPIKKSAVS